MRFRDAKKLHNGDEITIKANSTSRNCKETVKVVKTYENGKFVVVEAMTDDGYRRLYHIEFS